MFKEVIFTLLAATIAGSWAGPQCTGCFSPVHGDWRTDETLKEVVAKAVQELTSSIAKDFPADVANGPFVIDEILQFEQQVVAGINYRLTLRLKSATGKIFQCTDVSVFKPLPVYCQKDDKCLEVSSETINCAPGQ